MARSDPGLFLIAGFHHDLAVGGAAAFIGDEFKVFADEFVADGFPLGLVPDGEIGVALEGEIALDKGDVHAGRLLHGDGVNFGSAGDETFGLASGPGGFEGFVEGGEPFNAFGFWGVGVATDDEIAAFREGAADGGEGFAAHDDGMAGGEFAEAFEIVGEVPGQTASGADKAVGGHCHDDADLHES